MKREVRSRFAAGMTLVVLELSGCGGVAVHQGTAPIVQPQAPNAYYVATSGDDSADGSAARPFRTLARAQVAMETSTTKTALIEAGHYYLANTLRLTAADQGESWRSLDGGLVVISGGDSLTGWRSAGGGIYFAAAPHAVGLDFAVNGVRQTAADLGFDPDRPFITGWRVVDPTLTRTFGTTISVLPGDLTASVKPGATVQLLSDLRYSDNFTTIVSVDAANHTITLADPFQNGAAGGSTGRSASWRVLNDPADLQVPGQFAYDKNTGKVYVMPKSPSTLATDTVVAAQLSTLISLENVSRVTLSGLVFSDTVSAKSAYADVFDATSATISAVGMTNSTISGNTFVNAGNGIGMSGSSNNTITGNTFTSMGGSGIFLLNSSNNNTISSNVMTGLGRVNVASSGVTFGTVSSNTVDMNTIDGSGRYGMLLFAAANTISNNVIRNVNQQTSDTGAIYASAQSVPGWVNAQMTITGNRIENTGGLDRDGAGNYVPFGSYGIYMDDHAGGVAITKNVIESASSGVFLCHACQANSSDNNLIVLQAPGVYIRTSGGSAPATQDMDYNGSITFDLLPSFFPSGADTSVIVLQLSGDSSSGVGAHFNVDVDGSLIGSNTATAAVADFVYKVALAPHQHHQVSVQLDNGADTGTATRALHNIVVFVNNTAVQLQSGIVPFHVAGNDDLMVSTISVTHDIMYMNGGHGSVLADFTASSFPDYVDPSPGTIDYNLLYVQVDKASDPIFGTQPLDLHSVTADPQFTDAGSGDYTLKLNSPAAALGFVPNGVPLKPR